MDRLFVGAALACGLVSLLLIVLIGIGLYWKSAITRHTFGWHILNSSTWDVVHGIYGALPYIHGTLISSLLALVIAVPIGVGAAIFLAEVAPARIAAPFSFLIELLAAVPSIIFGLWGFYVLCPWLQSHISPWLVQHFGFIPGFQGPPVMTNLLAAGVILALMVLPLITSVSREVLRTVGAAQREGSLALGATRWETIRSVVLPASRSGIFGAIILAFGRAVGETMAVVMVIGNSPTLAKSLFQPAYTMPALLANEFNEAYSVPIQLSALVEIAFILFVITLIINALARFLILLVNRTAAGRGDETGADHTVRHELIHAISVGVVWILYFGLALFLLALVVRDVRQDGLRGLFGPVEIITVLFAATRWITARTRGTPHWVTWRKLNNSAVTLITAIAASIGCIAMSLLLGYVLIKGASALNLYFFTQLPKSPDDPTGGMKNGILGTLLLVLIASGIGIPVGLLGGVYLAEYGKGRIGGVLRFSADVLNGIPSVVIGMFAYTAFVLPVRHFSALAGGGALAIMMVPIVVRTTEEMLRLVPQSLREAAIGLGATPAQAVRTVILPAARAGVVTGMMLAVARIAGETAPLLFTAFGNDQVSLHLGEPVSSITLMIYRDATAGYGYWVAQAWAAALVLLLLVLIISLVSRVITRNRYALP